MGVAKITAYSTGAKATGKCLNKRFRGQYIGRTRALSLVFTTTSTSISITSQFANFPVKSAFPPFVAK